MTDHLPSKGDDSPPESSSKLRLPDAQSKAKSDRSWSLLVIFAVVAIVVVALLSRAKG